MGGENDNYIISYRRKNVKPYETDKNAFVSLQDVSDIISELVQ